MERRNHSGAALQFGRIPRRDHAARVKQPTGWRSLRRQYFPAVVSAGRRHAAVLGHAARVRRHASSDAGCERRRCRARARRLVLNDVAGVCVHTGGFLERLPPACSQASAAMDCGAGWRGRSVRARGNRCGDLNSVAGTIARGAEMPRRTWEAQRQSPPAAAFGHAAERPHDMPPAPPALDMELPRLHVPDRRRRDRVGVEGRFRHGSPARSCGRCPATTANITRGKGCYRF